MQNYFKYEIHWGITQIEIMHKETLLEKLWKIQSEESVSIYVYWLEVQASSFATFYAGLEMVDIATEMWV